MNYFIKRYVEKNKMQTETNDINDVMDGLTHDVWPIIRVFWQFLEILCINNIASANINDADANITVPTDNRSMKITLTNAESDVVKS